MGKELTRIFWGMFFGTVGILVFSMVPYLSFLSLPGDFASSLLVDPDAESAQGTFTLVFNAIFYGLLFLGLGSAFGRQRPL